MFTRLAFLFISFGLAAAPLQADTVHIPADRDTTLVEPTIYTQDDCPRTVGEICANGSGPFFFSGHTNQAEFGARRALVRFDVAAALPENALIDRVTLRLYQTSGNKDPSDVSVHRVLGDWGEGASFNTGGQGAPAEAGDATWLHTFYDYDYWVREGGHAVRHASATAEIGGNGTYLWENSVHLEYDVRLWHRAPGHNYGWLLMGDEETKGSVKRFVSREGSDSTRHPMLIVEYHLPGE